MHAEHDTGTRARCEWPDSTSAATHRAKFRTVCRILGFVTKSTGSSSYSPPPSLRSDALMGCSRAENEGKPAAR